MKIRKSVVAVGIAVAGAAGIIGTQGSAQAAAVQPVAAPAAAQSTAANEQPQAILSAVSKAAQKATVHAKAATKGGKSIGNISELGSLFGVPPANGTSPDGVTSVDVAFDK
ncbi:hypothetical protein [Streptomyces sparsus]